MQPTESAWNSTCLSHAGSPGEHPPATHQSTSVDEQLSDRSSGFLNDLAILINRLFNPPTTYHRDSFPTHHSHQEDAQSRFANRVPTRLMQFIRGCRRIALESLHGRDRHPFPTPSRVNLGNEPSGTAVARPLHLSPQRHLGEPQPPIRFPARVRTRAESASNTLR
jgi:hypothetical protein